VPRWFSAWAGTTGSSPLGRIALLVTSTGAAFRHLAKLLKFMEYCEPKPADYSTMSDEELLDQLHKHGGTV
jgi:hypothetical protein